MEAVEFNATVENGVIPIPQKYREAFSDNVKVFVRAEKKTEQKSAKKKKLYSIGIDMPGYKFNREEANERR